MERNNRVRQYEGAYLRSASTTYHWWHLGNHPDNGGLTLIVLNPGRCGVTQLQQKLGSLATVCRKDEQTSVHMHLVACTHCMNQTRNYHKIRGKESRNELTQFGRQV